MSGSCEHSLLDGLQGGHVLLVALALRLRGVGGVARGALVLVLRALDLLQPLHQLALVLPAGTFRLSVKHRVANCSGIPSALNIGG